MLAFQSRALPCPAWFFQVRLKTEGSYYLSQLERRLAVSLFFRKLAPPEKLTSLEMMVCFERISQGADKIGRNTERGMTIPRQRYESFGFL